MQIWAKISNEIILIWLFQYLWLGNQISWYQAFVTIEDYRLILVLDNTF